MKISVLCSYKFMPCKTQKSSGGNLDVRFGKQFSFAKYEVDVVVGLAFVVVQSRYTFHSVLLSELIRKFFKHLLRRKGSINLRQGDYQFPSLMLFSLRAVIIKSTILYGNCFISVSNSLQNSISSPSFFIESKRNSLG